MGAGESSPAAETLETAATYPPPARRTLRVFAYDPMVARLSGSGADVVTLSVPFEPLQRGPKGELIEVIDYDSTNQCCYPAVNLDHPHVLAQDGLTPSEADPRFHQQMVYAVVRSLLENFERGMGRRFGWSGNHPLRIYPHAFRAANAFFDPDADGRLLFGYFRADRLAPGRNLPDQHVFTCLSHDIVVHEATHALVHKNRKYLKDPTNADVYAFHEGFADLMALFQHFSLPDLVARHLQHVRGDLDSDTPLVELARQFGEGSGRGEALRRAIGHEPDPSLAALTFEPHARGALLVAAVFDGFLDAYRQASSDLIRLATSGSGVLPEGAIHPDLTRRLAAEACRLADRAQLMCVRAFEYLPPVDVDFSDFLRSLVTADRDLFPADEDGLRASIVEGFRRRGLLPTGVGSLNDAAVVWPTFDGALDLDEHFVTALLLKTAARYSTPRDSARRQALKLGDTVAMSLRRWASGRREVLGLDPDARVDVDGLHALFRIGAGGQPHIDIVARVVQAARPDAAGTSSEKVGQLPLRGGVTVVADSLGQVRYVISKPLPRANGDQRQVERLANLQSFASTVLGHHGLTPWRASPPAVADLLNFARVDDAGFDW
jgi:hypothetical protein